MSLFGWCYSVMPGNTKKLNNTLALSAARSLRVEYAMKYSDIKRGFRWEEACNYIGSRVLFEKFIKAKWITPIHKVNRLAIYDRSDLDRCLDRLKSGEEIPC
jgi:hypothetical protein